MVNIATKPSKPSKRSHKKVVFLEISGVLFPLLRPSNLFTKTPWSESRISRGKRCSTPILSPLSITIKIKILNTHNCFAALYNVHLLNPKP